MTYRTYPNPAVSCGLHPPTVRSPAEGRPPPSHYTVPCRGLAPTLPLYGPLPRVGPHPPTIRSSAEGRPPPSHYTVPCRGLLGEHNMREDLSPPYSHALVPQLPSPNLHERLGRPVSNAVWLERVQKTAQEDAISQ